MPINAVSSATQAKATTADTRQNDIGKKDIFLKLLVAQMKFQDPLKPQDPTKMSAQLAQFNMVEQQTNTNQLLEKILAKNTGGGSTDTAATWLGHNVTIRQNKIHFNGTPQSFTAQLSQAASQATVTILDAAGKPVRTMQTGALNVGANPLGWDGLTDSGATAVQGDYTIAINATDLQGQKVDAKILRSGIVDAVRFTTDGSQLMVAGIAAGTADITEIRP